MKFVLQTIPIQISGWTSHNRYLINHLKKLIIRNRSLKCDEKINIPLKFKNKNKAYGNVFRKASTLNIFRHSYQSENKIL